MEILETVRQAIEEFCIEFVSHPYLCYTEHGQHALFYNRLYNLIPEGKRYATYQDQRTTYQDQRICVIQKEYPTAGTLGKPKRQHWDVSVLQTPLTSSQAKEGYDYFRLLACIEFGLNATEEHLQDDIERLEHAGANVEQGFIVHLYRLSASRNKFSGRDLSHKSEQILNVEKVVDLSKRRSVEIYYGMADSTGTYKAGAWHIKNGVLRQLNL